MSSQIYYLDTSALIKRYVAEIGSGWIRAVVADIVADIETSGELVPEPIAT